MTEELTIIAFMLLLAHFSEVREMLWRKEKMEKIKAAIKSLSCRDCEQAKQGFCDAGLVGLEVWDCMVERALAQTIDKGNFPGDPGPTIH